MVNYFKKVMILKQAENSQVAVKGLVIIESLDDKAQFNFNFSSNVNKDFSIFIIGENADVKKLEKISGKNFYACYEKFSVTSGVIVAVFLGEELICYGEHGKSFYDLNGIISYAKKEFNTKNKEQNFKAESETSERVEEKNDYDDEQIANENYYQISNGAKSLREQDVALYQATKKAEKNEENTAELRENEKDTSACERRDFYEKIKDKLDEIFDKYETCNDLAETLPNGKFVKIHYAENKYYYVGKLYKEKEIKYICYGVTGYQNESGNELLNNFSFIPISNYELSGKGFYLIFQDAKTGEIVKKQE